MSAARSLPRVSAPTIVFVHLGTELPMWLVPALRQARFFNRCAIVLIAGSAALDAASIPSQLDITQVPLEELGQGEPHREFQRLSPFDRRFRDGFWTYTSERFFVLQTAFERLALRDVVHVENDILLYCPVDELVSKLSGLYPGVAATFDNDNRCVPGIVYLPSLRAIQAICDFYLQVLQRIADSAQANGLNDMHLLGAMRAFGPYVIDHLPIVPPDYPAPLRSAVGHMVRDPSAYSRHFDALGYIFDAAALGQFLGGIDPRNDPRPSVGFINESCVFDPTLLRPRLTRDRDGRRIPVVETGSGVYPVANLHVHSKNPAPFLSL